MQAFGNSEALVTYGTSGTIQLWDCGEMSLTDSGARDAIQVQHPPLFTATSTNGRLLASVAANSHTVVRDSLTLSVMHEMPPRLGTRVRSVSFSGDCRLMAVVLQDSSITIWDITSNEIMWQPQARGQMAAVNAHHVGVNGCFLSEVCFIIGPSQNCSCTAFLSSHDSYRICPAASSCAFSSPPLVSCTHQAFGGHRIVILACYRTSLLAGVGTTVLCV